MLLIQAEQLKIDEMKEIENDLIKYTRDCVEHSVNERIRAANMTASIAESKWRKRDVVYVCVCVCVCLCVCVCVCVCVWTVELGASVLCTFIINVISVHLLSLI
jgi:K+-sensing histidine kinase KdpD